MRGATTDGPYGEILFQVPKHEKDPRERQNLTKELDVKVVVSPKES
jgi:hypothetical protein